MRWSLGGVDAGDFNIDNGVLRFAKSPDYESPWAADGWAHSNTYVVDGPGHGRDPEDGAETVTVKVTNVDEDGTVELSALRPQSAIAFTATLDRSSTSAIS